MPDPTTAAYDLADQGGQSLVEQLLADPAFQQAIDSLINKQIDQYDESHITVPIVPLEDDDEEEPPPIPNPNPGLSVSCHTPIIMPPSGSIYATFSRELSMGGPNSNRMPGVPAESQYQTNDPSVASGD